MLIKLPTSRVKILMERRRNSTTFFLDAWTARKQRMHEHWKLVHNLWLFFFLVIAIRVGSTAFFALHKAKANYTVNLPVARSSKRLLTAETEPTLTLVPYGMYILDKRLLQKDRLPSELKAKLRTNKKRIRLIIDRDCHMSEVNSIFPILAEAGYTRLFFVTQ